jgi:hypothetical protein
VRTLLAITGALLATGLIAALALSGHTPGEGSLVRFEPAGIMGKFPEHVSQIELRVDGLTYMFKRDAANQWLNANQPNAPVQEAINQHIAAALRFLEVTTPSRVINRSQYSQALFTQIGLAPERYRVTLFAPGTSARIIEFGDLNPLKTAQYVRVLGDDRLYLMPLHFGSQWEAIAAAAGKTGQSSFVLTKPSESASHAGKPAASDLASPH